MMNLRKLLGLAVAGVAGGSVAVNAYRAGEALGATATVPEWEAVELREWTDRLAAALNAATLALPEDHPDRGRWRQVWQDFAGYKDTRIAAALNGEHEG